MKRDTPETSRPTLLVLAAGIGSRYGGLKQIDPVGPCGEIIIDYAIYDALRAGFGKVVFVIRRAIEADFKHAVGNRLARQIPVEYVFQELSDLPDGIAAPVSRTKPWGTGHAILAARHAVREPFAVINADDFYGPAGYRELHAFLAARKQAETRQWALVGFVLRKTLSAHGSVARGVCRCREDGRLDTVTEHLKIEGVDGGAVDTATGTRFSGEELVSMNMWGFTPDVFDVLGEGFRTFLSRHLDTPAAEFQIPTVVDARIRAGDARVRVLPSPDTWFGVTYPADKPAVQQGIRHRVERGDYPTPLWPADAD